jgi:hypothetical protein
MRKDAIVLSPAEKCIGQRGVLDEQTPQGVSVSVPDGCLHVHGIIDCIAAQPVFFSLIMLKAYFHFPDHLIKRPSAISAMLSPSVILSEVRVNARGESKDPGAAIGGHAGSGSSTETLFLLFSITRFPIRVIRCCGLLPRF